MNDLSISKVHLKDQDSLWHYYNNFGLSPALRFLGGGALDYKKITYSLGECFICSTASASGWGFEKQNNTDVYFVCYTHRGESTWEMNKHGVIKSSQQLCVVDSSMLVQGQFARGTSTDTIMIDAKVFDRELRSSRGIQRNDRLEFQSLLQNDKKIWSMINPLLMCIKNGMDLRQAQRSPLAMSYLKQALVSTLLELIPNNYHENRTRKSEPLIPRHIGRAIEYMHAHACEDILISDVATYAHTSVRNLQLGFRLHKNVSPMHYLRDLRLACAHDDLISEDERTGWQQIGLRWGFADLDLFARYYKDKYGNTPFQTQYMNKGDLIIDKL